MALVSNNNKINKNKTMYNKIKTIIEKGGLDVVVKCDHGFYRIFSSMMSNGNIRCSRNKTSIEKCKDFLGTAPYTKREIKNWSEKYDWKIVETIARQSHYEVGDKVKIKENGRIETIKEVLDIRGWEYRTDEDYYDGKDIEPYFEEEESKEEMIKIKGKEFSEDTIQKALEQYINK